MEKNSKYVKSSIASGRDCDATDFHLQFVDRRFYLPLIAEITQVYSVLSAILEGTDTGEKCMKNSFLEVSTNEGEVVPNHTELSKADMLLLDRAKWLVTRYCPSPGEGNEASIHLVPQSCGKIIDTDAVHGEKKVLDRGRSSSLIPSVSPVAERIRIEEEVLPTESSLAEEGWELHQLATKEGRTTAKASHMLLSFVDFLCEVRPEIILMYRLL